MPDRRREAASRVAAFAVITLFFFGLSWCMSAVWKFDFFYYKGDVYAYWNESLAWGMPFHPHHPPGYPWLIALLWTVSAGWLDPLTLLQALSFLFLAGGASLWIVLCNREGIPRHGWKAALLFAAWPFVGSLYAVYPQMDALVLFLLILGVMLSLDGRWIPAGAVLGVATLIHPLAWIFMPVLIPVPWIVWIWERRRRGPAAGSVSPASLWTMTALAIAPLIGFWIWEMILTGDPLWAVASIVDAQVVSRGSLPILDGWIGTIQSGGVSGWLKVGILSLVVLLSVYLLAAVLSRREAPADGRDRYRRIVSAVIPAAILGMALLLNQHEIWAVVRFSKILLLPLILQRDRLFGFVPPRFRMPAWGVLIAAGFLSQVAYARYMVKVFFGM